MICSIHFEVSDLLIIVFSKNTEINKYLVIQNNVN